MNKYLRYNDKNMAASAASAQKTPSAELRALKSRLLTAQAEIKRDRQSQKAGWLNLPFDEKTAVALMFLAKNAQRDFTDLIVIGMGGSSLGSQAIWQALNKQGAGLNLHFLDNLDPRTLQLWSKNNKLWKKTALCAISKSGETLETLANFAYLRHSLIKAVGRTRHNEHIFVITEKGQGSFYALAQKNNYYFLEHPKNVGGRFSVLSAAGLWPAACAGADVRKLLAGARAVAKAHWRQGITHPAVIFAARHYLGMKKHGQKIHVLMPYDQRLNGLANWYSQLWAESLGKNNKGPTPQTALGPADQHSQLQLYLEGPNDKIITFLNISQAEVQVRVPQQDWLNADLEIIIGRDFYEINQALQKGAALALFNQGRANGTLHIPKISEETLGALFYFYELAAAYFAQLMGIDAYNQPGVEQSKRLAIKILKNK